MKGRINVEWTYEDVEKAVALVLAKGPKRVIVNGEFGAMSTLRARKCLGIDPDIVFIRDDGWTLGAPLFLAKVAYQVWKERWIARVNLHTGDWTLMW